MQKEFVFEQGVYYVVDYNVALNMPQIFSPDARLPERRLIISMIFQRHGQKLRDKQSEAGEMASELSILLDKLVRDGKRSKIDGVNQYEIGNLHVIIDGRDHIDQTLNNIAGETIKDTIALAIYWNTKVAETSGKVLIVTNDPNTRLGAQDKTGCVVRQFNPAIYKGWRDVSPEERLCDYWRRDKIMTLDNFAEFYPGLTLNPHEYVFFTDRNDDFSMIGRLDPTVNKIVPLKYYQTLKWTKPYNRYQAAVLEGETLPKEQCIASFVAGPAGCGKTRLIAGVAIERSGILDQRFDESEQAHQKKGRKKANRKVDEEAWNGITAAFEGEDDEFLGYDLEGNERRRKPTKAPTFYDKPAQPQEPVETDYRGIVLIPPERMLKEHLTVPGDNYAKYSGLLKQYQDTAASILEARGDKLPGGKLPTARDNLARAISAVRQMEILPLSEINGRTLAYIAMLFDECEFANSEDIYAALGRLDVGAHGSFSFDPTQYNNRYGWQGNPAVKISSRYAENPFVSIFWFPFGDESCIIRPGGKLAMWGTQQIVF